MACKVCHQERLEGQFVPAHADAWGMAAKNVATSSLLMDRNRAQRACAPSDILPLSTAADAGSINVPVDT